MADFGPIMEKYTGSQAEDPKAWINTYTNSLDAAGIPPSMRHVYFCRNLDRLAHKWYIEEVQYSDKLYWDKLRAAFDAKWTLPYEHARNRDHNQASKLPPTTTANSTPSEILAARQKFREFIEIASLETIKVFLTTATSLPGSENLEILWNRAYEEGYQNGRKSLLQDLKKKLEDKYEEGQKEGIKKGKEKYYGKGIVKGECEEHKRWIAEGHSQRCFTRTVIFEDARVQTDPAATSTAISVQTHTQPPNSAFSTTYSTTGTQTNHRAILTLDDTSPSSTSTATSQLPSPLSTSTTTVTTTTSPASSHLMGVMAPPTTIPALETRQKTAGTPEIDRFQPGPPTPTRSRQIHNGFWNYYRQWSTSQLRYPL
jgi:hypothetical protein